MEHVCLKSEGLNELVLNNILIYNNTAIAKTQVLVDKLQELTGSMKQQQRQKLQQKQKSQQQQQQRKKNLHTPPKEVKSCSNLTDDSNDMENIADEDTNNNVPTETVDNKCDEVNNKLGLSCAKLSSAWAKL